MTIEDVKKLNWVLVTDWTRVPTVVRRKRNNIIYKWNIERFIRNLLIDISYKLNIHYTTLKPLFHEYNSDFFKLQEKLFTEKLYYYTNEPELLKLQSLLRIPDTSNVHISKVERLFSSFEELTDEEKEEFLQLLVSKK